jgi:hypothetical protein
VRGWEEGWGGEGEFATRKKVQTHFPLCSSPARARSHSRGPRGLLTNTMAFAGRAGGAIDDRVHARGPAADRLARGRRPADVFARQSLWAADLAARKAAATLAAREREREACTFMPTINPTPPVPPARLPSRSPPPPPLLTRQLGSPTPLPSSSSSVPVRGSVPFYALPTRTSELKLKGKEGEEGEARTRPRLSSGGPGPRGFRVGGRAGRAADLARRAVEEERDWAEREAAVASGLDEAEALVGRGVSLAAALLASLDAALGGGLEGAAAGPAAPPAATGAADTRPSPSPSAAPEAAARPAFALAQALFGPAQSSPPSPPPATHPRTATPPNSSGPPLRFDGLAAPFTPPFSSAAHSSPLSAIDALMQQAATPSSPSSSSADVLEASSRLQADLARLRQLSARTERVMARLIAEEEGGGGETS